MDALTGIAGILALGRSLFRLRDELLYLQGQLNGAATASVILLGLYLIFHRPTPRS